MSCLTHAGVGFDEQLCLSAFRSCDNPSHAFLYAAHIQLTDWFIKLDFGIRTLFCPGIPVWDEEACVLCLPRKRFVTQKALYPHNAVSTQEKDDAWANPA